MTRPLTSQDALRPQRLADFGGQPDVVAELGIILGGATARGETPPHLLFAGPPGLGKTTLSNIVANELGLPLVTTSGPAVEKPGDLAGLLVGLDRPTVVFIDEIHRLAAPVEEMLYTAMEDGRIDILVGEGPARSRPISMKIEPFVLVGATTKAGMLGGPLRDRFGYIGRLELYDVDTLAGIVTRSAGLLGRPIDQDAAALIAARSRGTPRIANRLLSRVRDVADQGGHSRLSEQVAQQALDLFGVDALGLDKVDRRILDTLVRSFGGGPVGVSTLAAAVNEETGTLEEVHEPYLMRVGLLNRTPRGRAATASTYRHLGLAVPAALAVPDVLPMLDAAGA